MEGTASKLDQLEAAATVTVVIHLGSGSYATQQPPAPLVLSVPRASLVLALAAPVLFAFRGSLILPSEPEPFYLTIAGTTPGTRTAAATNPIAWHKPMGVIADTYVAAAVVHGPVLPAPPVGSAAAAANSMAGSTATSTSRAYFDAAQRSLRGVDLAGRPLAAAAGAPLGAIGVCKPLELEAHFSLAQVASFGPSAYGVPWLPTAQPLSRVSPAVASPIPISNVASSTTSAVAAAATSTAAAAAGPSTAAAANGSFGAASAAGGTASPTGGAAVTAAGGLATPQQASYINPAALTYLSKLLKTAQHMQKRTLGAMHPALVTSFVKANAVRSNALATFALLSTACAKFGTSSSATTRCGDEWAGFSEFRRQIDAAAAADQLGGGGLTLAMAASAAAGTSSTSPGRDKDAAPSPNEDLGGTGGVGTPGAADAQQQRAAAAIDASVALANFRAAFASILATVEQPTSPAGAASPQVITSAAASPVPAPSPSPAHPALSYVVVVHGLPPADRLGRDPVLTLAVPAFVSGPAGAADASPSESRPSTLETALDRIRRVVAQAPHIVGAAPAPGSFGAAALGIPPPYAPLDSAHIGTSERSVAEGWQLTGADGRYTNPNVSFVQRFIINGVKGDPALLGAPLSFLVRHFGACDFALHLVAVV